MLRSLQLTRLTPSQVRYLALDQGLYAAAFNFVFNAGIGWWLSRGGTIPLCGVTSIVADLFFMSFVLPFSTSFTNTLLVRRDTRRGKVRPLDHVLAPADVPLAWRSALLGLACVVLFAPPIWAVLCTTGVHAMTTRAFVLFKGTIAAVQAMLVTPLVAVLALSAERTAPSHN